MGPAVPGSSLLEGDPPIGLKLLPFLSFHLKVQPPLNFDFQSRIFPLLGPVMHSLGRVIHRPSLNLTTLLGPFAVEESLVFLGHFAAIFSFFGETRFPRSSRAAPLFGDVISGTNSPSRTSAPLDWFGRFAPIALPEVFQQVGMTFFLSDGVSRFQLRVRFSRIAVSPRRGRL